MSQLQKYTNVTIYFNNRLQTENASVTVNRNAGLQPVNTVVKGFAGFSQGSTSLDIDVEDCVPLAGMETDTGDAQANGSIVQLTLVASGKTLTSKGGVMSDTLSYSVDGAAKLSYKFHGEFAKWQ